jgi:hypothetical protein
MLSAVEVELSDEEEWLPLLPSSAVVRGFADGRAGGWICSWGLSVGNARSRSDMFLIVLF